jgi:hypothetical protein
MQSFCIESANLYNKDPAVPKQVTSCFTPPFPSSRLSPSSPAFPSRQVTFIPAYVYEFFERSPPEVMSAEPMIVGPFVKHSNNAGKIFTDRSDSLPLFPLPLPFFLPSLSSACPFLPVLCRSCPPACFSTFSALALAPSPLPHSEQEHTGCVLALYL